MSREQLYPLFPTPVYRNNIGNDYEVSFSDSDLTSFEYSPGQQTKDENYLLKRKNRVLRNKIESEIEVYLRQYLRLSKDVFLKHQCSWVLLHKKGDYSPEHFHSNSWLSGIYYHRVNPKSGRLRIIASRPYSWSCSQMCPKDKIEEFNVLNSLIQNFLPLPGDIFLFPSHVNHDSEMNSSDQDRICVVFNYTLHGKWGKVTERISI